MNIMNLAQAIAPECKTEIIGIRPGEKLHEVMIPMDETRKTIEFDKYYVVQPDFGYWERHFKSRGEKAVPDGFEYNSGTNPWQLTIDEMKNIIKDLKN